MRERRDNRKDRETEADGRELMWCHTVDNHWCACVCLSKGEKKERIYVTMIELLLYRVKAVISFKIQLSIITDL